MKHRVILGAVGQLVRADTCPQKSLYTDVKLAFQVGEKVSETSSLGIRMALSGYQSERLGSETAAPEQRTAHTGGHPPRAMSCGPG